MTYAVKEIFLTLQGEGRQAGRRAVFLRFAGCNLWSGREEDRASAVCRFCDTDFVGTDGQGGGKFADAEALGDTVARCWDGGGGERLDRRPREGGGLRERQVPRSATGPRLRGGDDSYRLVVITGGEPMLQLDAALIDALHARKFEIAVESNGTIAAPDGIDWLCISPKAGSETVQRSGDELKLVWPQPGSDWAAMQGWDFRNFLVQPMDGPEIEANRAACVDFVLANPGWRLSLQTHKWIGIA